LAFGWNRHLIPEDVEEDGDEDPSKYSGEGDKFFASFASFTGLMLKGLRTND